MWNISLPEGTEVEILEIPSFGDSPVGKGAVVRDMQYEVREGGEAGEVVIIPKAFIAKRNQSFILLVQEAVDDSSPEGFEAGRSEVRDEAG